MATAKENALMKMGHSEASAAMVSLKRSKKDKKNDMTAPSPAYEGEDYPYGTRIELNEDQLDKLDFEPKAGDTVHIHARGKVTSVNESTNYSGEGKKSRCNVSIQITKIAIT